MTGGKTTSGLTAKQKLFVSEYLKDRNATAAYERAGYKAKGRAAQACSSRLLSNAIIKAAVDAGIQRLRDKVEVTAEEVLAGLRTEAKVTGEGSSHSARVRAWELLGKHIGMFVEKHEHTGAGGKPLIGDSVRAALADEKTREILALISDRLGSSGGDDQPGGTGAV